MRVPGAAAVRSGRPVVVAGTAAVAVTYGLVRFGYGLHLPTFQQEFDLSRTVSGAVAAGAFAGYCLAALLAHRHVRRGRARLALWQACGLAATGSLGIAWAWSPAALAVAVVVGGSGAGMVSPALVAAVDATVAGRRVERAQAVVNSGTGVGVVVAAVLAAALAGQWRSIWVGVAVAALLVAGAVDRWAVWPPAPVATGRGRADLVALRAAVLAAVLAGAGSAAVWTFGRDVLTTSGALSPSGTAGLWCLLGGAGALGALSGDAVRRAGVGRAWVGTAATAAAATALLGHRPGSVVLAALALAAFGAAYVGLSGVLIAWGARAVPHGAAPSTATLFIALTAGQAAGAVLVGAVAEAHGMPTGFTVAAALLLGSATVAARAG